MAKSFFPKSANELCQVGKIDESLLSLKYLFPIEERQLKSTSVIETETKNLDEIILLIEKSNDVENQNKNKLLDLLFKQKIQFHY
jgi:taurine transport system permease protein